VLRTTLAFLAAAGIACTAAPASEQLPVIAPGVRILGTPVGGMTLDPARARLQAALDRSIAISYRGELLATPPADLGAGASIEGVLARALRARPRRHLPLRVSFSADAVSAYVASLAEQYDRRPRSAALLGADASGPIIRPGRAGRAVEQAALQAAIEQQLSTGSRAPLALQTDPIAPRRTADAFGPVVVIDRTANTLRLYESTHLARTFEVATGQSSYPTPSGMWRIVTMQENPWWIPPPSPWAAGAKPVPPGPGNPLGTRWMGLEASGVGIHGTPDDASIGYSESHGCIRMHIPDAEWLFQHVAVGTPVVIL
jgi:lipoprotein-anchoring transpeptidase ErfK/SrfK